MREISDNERTKSPLISEFLCKGMKKNRKNSFALRIYCCFVLYKSKTKITTLSFEYFFLGLGSCIAEKP